MSERRTQLFTIAMSVGISAGVVLWLQSRAVPPAPMAPASFDVAHIEGLEQAVVRLERQLSEQRADADRSVGGVAATPSEDRTARAASGTSDGIDLVRSRMTALERRTRALEQRLTDGSPVRAPRPEPTAEERQRLVGIQHQVILDPTKTTADKIDAHRKLRSESEGYTEAIVQELARIGLHDLDPKIRADVWRQFDGQQKPRSLIPSLLQALARDSSSDVRDEAAETLENFVDDPRVLQALRYAAEHDADPKVRKRSLRTLKERDEQRVRGR